MKKISTLITFALLSVFIFTSCGKEEAVKDEPNWRITEDTGNYLYAEGEKFNVDSIECRIHKYSAIKVVLGTSIERYIPDIF